MKIAKRKKYRKHVPGSDPQGPPNPGFMQEKVQKGGFLKKTLARIDFFFFVLTEDL